MKCKINNIELNAKLYKIMWITGTCIVNFNWLLKNKNKSIKLIGKLKYSIILKISNNKTNNNKSFKEYTLYSNFKNMNKVFRVFLHFNFK